MFWHRLDLAARSLVPFVVTVIAVLLTLAPVPIPGYGPVAPSLTLIVVYYWAIYRPDLLSLWVVLGIGLFQDLLTGPLIGMNALILILTYRIVTTQRRAFLGRSFPRVWWIFLLLALGAGIAEWIAQSAFNWRLVSTQPILYQVGMTVAMFPILAWVLIRMQRMFLRQV